MQLEKTSMSAPVHAVVSDETYYRERLELLIAWLEKNEQLHEAEAEADLNSYQRESARKNLAVAAMAKRTRMWIRNRVTFSR